jgi:hypothetical protein
VLRDAALPRRERDDALVVLARAARVVPPRFRRDAPAVRADDLDDLDDDVLL